MKIFLDFDDTLFATGKFAIDLKRILEDRGVQEKQFEKIYREVKEKCGRFDPEEMARCLEGKFSICSSESIECIESFLKKSEEYVFSDVDEFLKAFPKESLFILTFGDKIFQKVKVEKSGLGRRVQKTIIIQQGKGEALKDFLENEDKEEVYFIDDWLEQIENVKKEFPKAITFLMQREEGRHKAEPNESCDFLVHNLATVLKIIQEKENKKAI